MIRRTIQRALRGYSAADAEILRLKIASGANPDWDRLDLWQRRALTDMPDDEIRQLCGDTR